MRALVISLAASSLLVGCSSQDSLALEHRAELSAQTRGVQLTDDGRNSNVGMLNTTCDVGTRYAVVSEDFDYDGDEDRVVDAIELPETGFTALVITENRVNMTTPNRFPITNSFEVEGVLDAEMLDDGGFVAVQVDPTVDVDCAVAWYDANGQPSTGVNQLGVECDDQSSITADTTNGTSWVSTNSGVFQITPDGTVSLVDDTPNAKVVWDGVADVLYLGALGGEVVRGLEASGSQRWEADLGGTLTALADMGADASAAAGVTLADGTGQFVVIDGVTGEIRADLPTPSAATALNVSANGEVLAVTLPNSVHYFDILPVE